LNPGHGFSSVFSTNGDNITLEIDYKALREDFEKWLKERVDKKTCHDYLRYLDRHLLNLEQPIQNPQDLSNLLNQIEKTGAKKWFSIAFRNLLTYLEEVHDIDADVLDKFRKQAKIARTGVREIYISNLELQRAYENIYYRGSKAELLFKLLVYSGIRLKHAVELIRNFKKENLILIEDKGIARYPIMQFSKGQKRGFFAYMPIHFAKHLKKLRIGYSTAKNLITHERVFANTIRKWHYNFLIQNDIPPEIADFIQGRAAASVGAMHYLASARQADKFYAKVVDKFPKLSLEV
jgi:intergrase/recombinase